MGRGVRLRGWRKIATATWRAPHDPQVYGTLEIDAAALLAFISTAREERGERLTVTTLVGKAAAHALATHPDLDVRLRGGRAVPRDGVDVFFQAASDEGRDLTGVVVRGADRKSAADVAAEVGDGARRIRDGERIGLARVSGILDRLPRPLLRAVLAASGWLVGTADVDLSALGVPRQPFGGVMVSSVGMFGIEQAFAPLGPYYRVPAVLVVGRVTERPVAVQGRVMARQMLTIGVTLDHRYLDGHQAGRLAESIKAYCHDPARYEPPEPPEPPEPLDPSESSSR